MDNRGAVTNLLAGFMNQADYDRYVLTRIILIGMRNPLILDETNL